MTQWTPAMDDLLRALIAKRHSSHSAAMEFRRRLGVELSRNSMIGRAGRKGWRFNSQDHTAARGLAKVKPAKPLKAKPIKRPSIAMTFDANFGMHRHQVRRPIQQSAPVEPQARGPLEDVPASGCRWIHGDPQQPRWQCCGARQIEGSAYCVHHEQRCRSHLTKRQKRFTDPKFNPMWAA